MKFTSIVAALLYAVSAQEEEIDARIVGGEPTEPNRHPYMAGMINRRSTSPFCGGTLITPTKVLTAAHCPQPDFVQIGCDTVGASNCEYINVLSSRTAPDYSQRPVPQKDWRELTLASPSRNTPIPNVATAAWDALPADTDVFVIGFGLTRGNGQTSPRLLETDQKVMSQDDCQDIIDNFGVKLDRSMICGNKEGSSACNGDSGGPLLVRCPNGQDTIVGIVSWGAAGCPTSTFPTVYGRVSFADDDGFFTGLGLSAGNPLNPCA